MTRPGELSFDSKKSPAILKRRGLSWVGETLEVSCLTITPTRNAAFGSAPLDGSALPFQIYRVIGRRGTE